MDFKDLSYVIAISEHQNITKAANSLYLSQPTLTKFVQNLEKNLGQKLFRKVGNKFLLTYAGERYVAKATEILALKKELDQEMADIIRSNVGSLNIAFPAVRGTYMLPCTLPIFKSLYPNVKINVIEADSSHLDAMILAGSIDLAFYNGPSKSPDINYEIINSEEILLVMSPKHPAAKKGIQKDGCTYPWIDLTTIKDEFFILQKPEQRTRQIINNLLKETNISLDNHLVTSNIRAAAELAAKNYGLTFICETHLKHIGLTNDLMCFSLGNPKLTMNFVAAYRKGAYISYHASEYIKIVKDFT